MSYLLRRKIGFLLHLPELFHHYRPVMALLDPADYELLIPDDADESIAQIADAFELPYSYVGEVLQHRNIYRYLISDHFFLEDYHLLRRLGAYQIRWISELGCDQLQLGNWNNIYDMILCMGPYQAKRLQFCRRTQIHRIGLPHYDRLYRDDTDWDLLPLIERLGLDLAKRTVLWLPSAYEFSSVELYAGAISALREHYNVVVKPHPLTLREEPDRMELLAGHAFTSLVYDPLDLADLFQLTDVVLADYGHAPFEAIYANRNLLLLNTPHAIDHPHIGWGSSDLNVRVYLRTLNPDEGDELPFLLADDDYWERQRAQRDHLCGTYFNPYFGNAAKQAVDIIGNLDEYF